MGLVLWLPLTNNTSNYGLNPTTFVASEVTSTFTDGPFGRSMQGNGATTSLDSYRTVDLGPKQSLFCWVKANSFDTSPVGICGNHLYQQWTNLSLNFVKSTASAAYLSVSVGRTCNRHWSEHKSTTLLQAGVWYHVGYTYDGATLKLYINGKLNTSYSISDIQTGPAKFECFRWATDHSGYYLNGYLNDVRAYNHVLSQKEIKEISKALMTHYTFHTEITYPVTNVIQVPQKIEDLGAIGWDTALHPGAISVTGWSKGYNGGVPSPAIGYHAHWKLINDIPTMVFPKLNHNISGISATRWLGINTSLANVQKTIGPSTTYTISFDAMADSPGRELYGGYYYRLSGGSSNGFHDGSWYAKNIPVGKWKRYAFTFTTKSNLDSSVDANFYFYGKDGANGIAYVRNVLIEQGGTAHLPVQEMAYSIGGTYLSTTVEDTSGAWHSSAIIGSLKQVPYYPNGTDTSNAHKNFNVAEFDGSTYLESVPQGLPATFTIACWINKNGSGHALDWRTESSASAGVQPMYFNGPSMQFYSSNGASQYFNYSFSDNTWYHVAIVADGAQVVLYVNGVPQQTIASAVPGGSTVTLHVGSRASHTNVMKMKMYDFRIYGTALLEADIQNLYSTAAAIDKQENISCHELREGE